MRSLGDWLLPGLHAGRQDVKATLLELPAPETHPLHA